MSKKTNNVIVGTLILSASSIFVRMIGFFFRVYLSNTMGAEGMGLYSLVMSVYGFSITLATSSISIAISKLVAEQLSVGQRANARRILRRSLTLAIGISGVVAGGLFFFADPIATMVLKDPRTRLSLLLLAPGLPFVSVSACLRGYFIAERRMGNPASGQVIEQLFKMAFIMLLIGRYLPRGIEQGCALVVLGITLGEGVCFLYSLGGYLLEKREGRIRQRADITGVTRSILSIIVPISASSYVRSGLRLLEDVLILSGFRKFSGQDDIATGTYGMVKGMVMPLLLFPLQLLSAFVVTLTPEISRMNVGSDHRKLEQAICRILQYTSIVGIFIVSIFMTFSYELGVVVYKDPAVGEMLRTLAWLCPFMCIEMVVVGILQGLGEQVSSLRYNVSDSVLRIGLVWLLIPHSGVDGFMLMVVISNLFTSVLNLRRLLKVTSVRLQVNDWMLKPCLAAACSSQVVRVLCNLTPLRELSMLPSLLVGLVLISAIYTAVLFSIGSVRLSDLSWLTRRLRLSRKPVQPAAKEAAI